MKRFFCLMLLLTMCMCCLTGCVVKRFEGPNELGYLEEEDMWGYRTYDYDDYQDFMKDLDTTKYELVDFGLWTNLWLKSYYAVYFREKDNYTPIENPNIETITDSVKEIYKKDTEYMIILNDDTIIRVDSSIIKFIILTDSNILIREKNADGTTKKITFYLTQEMYNNINYSCC